LPGWGSAAGESRHFVGGEPQIGNRVISGWREQAAFASRVFGYQSDRCLSSQEVPAWTLNLAVSIGRDRAESESIYKGVTAASQSDHEFARPDLQQPSALLCSVLSTSASSSINRRNGSNRRRSALKTTVTSRGKTTHDLVSATSAT
jgi:hypothetical protein